MKIYHVSLQKGLRSPFRPDDELHLKNESDTQKEKKKDSLKVENGELDQEKGEINTNGEPALVITIDRENIQKRIQEVPVPAGNYSKLQGGDNELYFTERETGLKPKKHLKGLKINNEDPKLLTIVEDIKGFEMSADRKKMLICKGEELYIVEVGTSTISKLNAAIAHLLEKLEKDPRKVSPPPAFPNRSFENRDSGFRR